MFGKNGPFIIVGADDYIGPPVKSKILPVKSGVGACMRADVGIGPYRVIFNTRTVNAEGDNTNTEGGCV